MVATTFGTPTSIGSPNTTGHVVSYANGYYFSLSYDTSGASDVLSLQYAADPTASWSSATMPAAPSGYPRVAGFSMRHGVVYGNGEYAFALSYDSGGTASKTYAVHNSSPSGTWTATQIGTATNLSCADMIYAGGTFVAVGRDYSTSGPAWIAYATATTATWTINNTTATTGYDSTADWRLECIDYDGSQFFTVANGPGTVDGGRYSTSLTGGWGTVTFTQNFSTNKELRYHSGASTWTLMDPNGFDNVLYATDPAGAWGTVSKASLGMTIETRDIVYGAGMWIAIGTERPGSFQQPKVTYLLGTSPQGTYTAVDSTAFTAQSANVRGWTTTYANGYFLTGSRAAISEVRYLAWSAVAAAARYLRQRQSPVRAPSRVRPPQLRQRQRPEVT